MLLDNPAPSAVEIDRLRRKAKAAIAASPRTFADWIAIGRYLATGQAWAMEMSHSSAPAGVRYNDAMAVWLGRNPDFKLIDKRTRSILMACLAILTSMYCEKGPDRE
jgi:hypothetical protein